MKNFVLIDREGDGAAIGVLINVHKDTVNLEQRIVTALQDYYDADVIIKKMPDLFDEPQYECTLVLDVEDYGEIEVGISTTFLY